ncbi:MAG: aminopeptidase P family protein [Mogibacterium sp.]|nr:aminopeptidase P family protein [Mogibacterium sp.]
MQSSDIRERLAALRDHMRGEGIAACIVPTGDYHLSEYVADHFKTRKYITGFSGSAGTAVITLDDAGLWTDSRYYLQAGMQLADTGITLYKAQEPATPSIPLWLRKQLHSGDVVGTDGRIISCSTYDAWKTELGLDQIVLRDDYDPFTELWTDRPALPCHPAYELDLAYTGQSRADKLSDLRADMERLHADFFFLAKMDDICWLLNLRGDDVHCNPVVLSFLLVGHDQAVLFAQEEEFSAELRDSLAADGVSLLPYDAAGDKLAQLPPESSVWLSLQTVSAGLRNRVPSDVRIVDRTNPTILRKAIKNETEQECARLAHRKDGAAVTRWIRWVKQSVAAGDTVTEISAAEKLHEFRAEQEHFIEDSFDPIIGYGPHGAIVHYFATPESDIPLEPHGLLLADSGGQYLEGTTDITRTFALGPVSEEERRMFTAVLRGHIALASAVFPRGINGGNLDCLAHGPLWQMRLDYGHGTGHGVGQLLNVHEGPQVFHWTFNGITRTCPAFQPGMITSDEPGFYAEGAFGIRHENLLLCVADEKTAFGDFLKFEPLTMVPFDREAIDPSLMTGPELAWLNAYHQEVYEKVAPFLNEEERAWLAEATAPIA